MKYTKISQRVRSTQCGLLIIALLINHPAYAYIANGNNSAFYYEIGGARSITAPLYTHSRSKKLSGSAEFGLGYSCGKFDFTLGISNLLNSLSGLGDSILNGAIGAVSAAISSLPALILQRVSPGLYDLYQNVLIRAEATIALANKTCEQYESDIRQGKNPYSEWTDLSKMIDWKVEMQTADRGGDTDVHRAKEKVEKSNGENGIPWVEGAKKGGKDQPPIKVTEDIVKAGYNLTLNQPAGSNASVSSSTDSRLVEVFPAPASAQTWGKEVLGDVIIRTFDNHPVNTVPGHGLAPKIEQEALTVMTTLGELVAGTKKPEVSHLTAASSADVLINQDLIKAIQSMEPSEQSIAMGKLASEVAMSRTMEKALFLRRMLITGTREPNIANAPQAIEYSKDVLQILDKEIENILFEKRIRKELTSNTAQTILRLRTHTEKRGQIDMKNRKYDRKLITDSAIETP